MKPEQQRIAIAEFCGWKVFSLNNANHIEGNAVITMDTVPDYLNDLNAIQEAVMTGLIDSDQKDRYKDNLRSICRAYSDSAWVMINATAEQRCEAFVSTMEAE